jgi:TnpA family transposase
MSKGKRLSILTDAEVKELYAPPILSESEQRYFFTLNDRETQEINRLRDRKLRTVAIALLGYFKSKPIILNPSYKSMQADLSFISETHFQGLKLRRFTLQPDQKSRIYERVLSLLGVANWSDKKHQALLTDHLVEQAASWAGPRALFDAATEFLAYNKIAIPVYSTMQKIISQALMRHHADLHERLKPVCSDGLAGMMKELLSGETNFTIQSLRQSARNFTGTELQKELNVYHQLQPWMNDIKTVHSKLCLSQRNEHYYSEKVDYYSAKLKRQSVPNQQLYLLSYFQHRYQQCLERIADGFIHHVRQVKSRARSMAKEQVYQDWQKASRNVTKAADILHLFIDENIDPDTQFKAVKNQAFKVLNAKDLASVYRYMSNQKQSSEEVFWQHLDSESPLRTGLLRQLFCCLKIEGTDKTQRLGRILENARQDLLSKKVIEDRSVDKRLPKKDTREFLLDGDNEINIERYEWYLYLQVPDRLQGQLTLPEVVKYRALEADLVHVKDWRPKKESLLSATAKPKLMEDPDDLIPTMVQELNDRMVQVAHFLEHEDNRDVILRHKAGKRYWRLPSANKQHLVNNPFFEQMLSVEIADVLRVVDQDTGFIDDFEHVLGMSSKSRQFEVDILAILIANATNQGIWSISEISDRSYDQLKTIQANYLRLETLNSANDRINNATASLPIFKHYNIQEGLMHVSADGQKFESKRETFRTRYSSKYFGASKGLSNIGINANHAAITNRIIGANEHESHYILDLLVNNSTDITPDVLSTDSHGVNHVNFALLDLFGYQFAPRYAKVGTVIDKMFDVQTDRNDRIRISLKKPINTKRIMEHWDTIQRIGVSLAQRKTDQATLIRKLSGYKHNHPLLEALTEYNRLVKALYLLNYIDNAELRNHVQKALNRGEAYHQLRRAISQVNGDRFRGNSDEEIELWNECARLMANAIIYFNSKVLSNLLQSFERQGKEELADIIKRASPVAWDNINLKGKYLFAHSGEPADIERLMSPIEDYVPITVIEG